MLSKEEVNLFFKFIALFCALQIELLQFVQIKQMKIFQFKAKRNVHKKDLF